MNVLSLLDVHKAPALTASGGATKDLARPTVEYHSIPNMFRRESLESAPLGENHVLARLHCHHLTDAQAIRYDHSVNPSLACGEAVLPIFSFKKGHLWPLVAQ